MYEKISDTETRKEKVRMLKQNILMDIEKKMCFLKVDIKSCMLSDDEFNYSVKRFYALLCLKKYIENKHTFMLYTFKCPDEDAIVYVVGIKNIEIWLQDDYYFVDKFLSEAERCDFNISPCLEDRYFGRYFSSLLDSVIYDKRISEQEN